MATAAQLAQRRALVAAATRRRLPRPAAMLRAQLPRPIAYTRALTDVAAELNDALAAALSDELGVRVDAADGDATVPPFNRAGLLARLQRLAAGVVKRRGSLIDRAIDACAEGVASKSKAEWARQAKAAVGIDLAAIEPNLTPTINAFRRANLELITSMAKDKVERVKALLTEHAGARVETLRDRIMEEQGVTKRQAALIARDQVLSLNAQVTQKRHAAAGVSKYIWRTSGDGDVRPAHRALDGKVFSYDDPPVVDAKKGRREHPGEDYQCRCTAEPVIDGLDEVEEPAARKDAGDFKEGDHPRAKDGEFTKGGGGGPSGGKTGEGESAAATSGGRRGNRTHGPYKPLDPSKFGVVHVAPRDFGEPVEHPLPHIQQPVGSVLCGPAAGAMVAAHFNVQGPIADRIAASPKYIPEHGIVALDLPGPMNQIVPVPGRLWAAEDRYPDESTVPSVAKSLQQALHDGGGVVILNMDIPVPPHERGPRESYMHVVTLLRVEGDHAVISDPEAASVTRVPIGPDGQLGGMKWTGEVVLAKLTKS